jgi:hypothetical protein
MLAVEMYTNHVEGDEQEGNARPPENQALSRKGLKFRRLLPRVPDKTITVIGLSTRPCPSHPTEFSNHEEPPSAEAALPAWRAHRRRPRRPPLRLVESDGVGVTSSILPIFIPERASARRADWAPGPGVFVPLPDCRR